MKDRDKLNTLLKVLIEDSGLMTKSEWAASLSVSNSAISQWLKNDSFPQPQKLKRLIDTLEESKSVNANVECSLARFWELIDLPCDVGRANSRNAVPTLGEYLLEGEASALNDNLKSLPYRFASEILRIGNEFVMRCIERSLEEGASLDEMLNSLKQFDPESIVKRIQVDSPEQVPVTLNEPMEDVEVNKGLGTIEIRVKVANPLSPSWIFDPVKSELNKLVLLSAIKSSLFRHGLDDDLRNSSRVFLPIDSSFLDIEGTNSEIHTYQNILNFYSKEEVEKRSMTGNIVEQFSAAFLKSHFSDDNPGLLLMLIQSALFSELKSSDSALFEWQRARKLVLELYKRDLNSKELENRSISIHSFRSLVDIALGCGETDFAKSFIVKHKDRLMGGATSSALKYCNANYLIFCGKEKKAHQLLADFDSSDSVFNLFRCILQLRTSWRLGLEKIFDNSLEDLKKNIQVMNSVYPDIGDSFGTRFNWYDQLRRNVDLQAPRDWESFANETKDIDLIEDGEWLLNAANRIPQLVL